MFSKKEKKSFVWCYITTTHPHDPPIIGRNGRPCCIRHRRRLCFPPHVKEEQPQTNWRRSMTEIRELRETSAGWSARWLRPPHLDSIKIIREKAPRKNRMPHNKSCVPGGGGNQSIDKLIFVSFNLDLLLHTRHAISFPDPNLLFRRFLQHFSPLDKNLICFSNGINVPGIGGSRRLLPLIQRMLTWRRRSTNVLFSLEDGRCSILIFPLG